MFVCDRSRLWCFVMRLLLAFGATDLHSFYAFVKRRVNFGTAHWCVGFVGLTHWIVVAFMVRAVMPARIGKWSHLRAAAAKTKRDVGVVVRGVCARMRVRIGFGWRTMLIPWCELCCSQCAFILSAPRCVWVRFRVVCVWACSMVD